jgi:hypothetical protein
VLADEAPQAAQTMCRPETTRAASGPECGADNAPGINALSLCQLNVASRSETAGGSMPAYTPT